MSVVCLLAFVATLMSIAPTLLAARDAKSGRGHVRLILANLNYKNQQYSRAIDYLDQCDADILVLEEYTPDWQQKIAESLLKTHHPFVIAETRPDTFGIAVLSRLPSLKAQTLHLAKSDFPSTICQVDFAGIPVNVVAAHFMGPMTPRGWSQQSARIQELSDHSELINQSVVVAGDFNTTPWTHNFNKLLTGLHLKDSLCGSVFKHPGRPLNQSWSFAN